MAKTTKNTEPVENQVEVTAEAKEETVTVVDTLKETNTPKEVDTAKENEELKATVAALQAQMEMMAKMLSSAPVVQNETTKRPERNIKFINLINGTVVLRGSNIWTIEGQLNSRSFMEREARLIVSNCNNLIRSGAVYIADEEFVEENDLGEVYRYLMNNEDLNNLFDKPSSEIIEIYNNAPDVQKRVIVAAIIEKRMKGETVDGNVLMQISSLSGKDLMSIEAEE